MVLIDVTLCISILSGIRLIVESHTRSSDTSVLGRNFCRRILTQSICNQELCIPPGLLSFR